MNHIIHSLSTYVLVVALIASIVVPQTTLAAQRPSCSLDVETQKGEITVNNRGEETILISKGDEVSIAWEGDNAEEAFLNGEEIDVKDQEDFEPEESTTYTFEFEDGSRSAECTLSVLVVDGEFDEDRLHTTASRTTLKGTVEGTKTVQVHVTKEGETKPVFKSKNIRVKNGEWSARITKSLKDGEYTVTLLGDRKAELNTITTDTLIVGDEDEVTPKKTTSSKKDTPATSSDTTFVIESIPLLVGGKTKVNTSIPIAYFQAINIGTSAGVVEEVHVQHKGSATAQAIAGFTITDDKSLTNVVYMPEKGTALFDTNGTAIVPLDATIAGRDMRLFTVRAILAPTAFAQYGKQLQMTISDVNTNANERSKFPLPGTTWTIGF